VLLPTLAAKPFFVSTSKTGQLVKPNEPPFKEAMRKQYHFRKSRNGFYAWDVERLVALSKGIAIIEIPLNTIAEIDEDYWFAGSAESPTCRRIAEHCELINKADLSHPVILCSEGRVMDGMHRIAKALLAKRSTVKADARARLCRRFSR
jgi:hypothetical protein